MGSMRQDVQFSNPTITKSFFKVNKNFNQDEFKGFGELKLNLNKHFDDGSEEKNLSEGTVLLSLEIIIGDNNTAFPFMFEFEIESIFKWNDFRGENISRFLEVNGAAILYSYSRSHISNITNSSRYPSFDLPFYNFTSNE